MEILLGMALLMILSPFLLILGYFIMVLVVILAYFAIIVLYLIIVLPIALVYEIYKKLKKKL